MKTNKYESIIIIDSQLNEETIKGTIEKFKALIETHGQVESIEEWGNRRLAYPIKYKDDGFYVLINFNAEPDFPLEFERVLKITDGILKFLVIRKDEKELSRNKLSN